MKWQTKLEEREHELNVLEQNMKEARKDAIDEATRIWRECSDVW